MMWHSVKFQFALLFTILRTSTHLGTVQLKDDATDDGLVENITSIERIHTREKHTFVRILQIAGHTNLSHQIQELKRGEHLWSPHSQSLAIFSSRHQSREVEHHFVSCLPHYWPCVDG